MPDDEEPEPDVRADEPTTEIHTYTAMNDATASLEIPVGYTPPDGLSMVKAGNPYPVAFIHDEFEPQAYVAPPTTTPPPSTTLP